jgi:hypothetical protein
MLRNISEFESRPNHTLLTTLSDHRAALVDAQAEGTLFGIVDDTLQDLAALPEDDLFDPMSPWPFDDVFSDTNNVDWVNIKSELI